MLLPLLLIGALAFWVGKQNRTQGGTVVGAVGALGPAAPTSAARAGEKVRFEFGVPYLVIATTGALSSAERARLYSWLTFGTYHGRNIAFGSSRPGTTSVSLSFIAPKASVVPIGQPLDWDLGEGKLRLVLREVRRLDGEPLTIGARRLSPRLAELARSTHASLAYASGMRRPLGGIVADATRKAIEWEERGLIRPSETPEFFDSLASFTRRLERGQ